jgi:hypothetical protein
MMSFNGASTFYTHFLLSISKLLCLHSERGNV